MLIDIDKDGYTQEDVEAAFKTGIETAKDLERYAREVANILSNVEQYADVGKPSTVAMRSDLLRDFERAARYAGRVDRIGESFGHEFTANYKGLMEPSLRLIGRYLQEAFERMHKAELPTGA